MRGEHLRHCICWLLLVELLLSVCLATYVTVIIVYLFCVQSYNCSYCGADPPSRCWRQIWKFCYLLSCLGILLPCKSRSSEILYRPTVCKVVDPPLVLLLMIVMSHHACLNIGRVILRRRHLTLTHCYLVVCARVGSLLVYSFPKCRWGSKRLFDIAVKLYPITLCHC